MTAITASDMEIRREGMRALHDALGPVNAGRFVSLMLREPFDYTLWQRDLWPGKSVEELFAAGRARGQMEDPQKT